MAFFLRGMRWLIAFFLVAAGLSLLLALFNLTNINPLILAALALTWAVWAGLLAWVLRRFHAYQRERGEAFDFDLNTDVVRFKRKRKQQEEPS